MGLGQNLGGRPLGETSCETLSGGRKRLIDGIKVPLEHQQRNWSSWRVLFVHLLTQQQTKRWPEFLLAIVGGAPGSSHNGNSSL